MSDAAAATQPGPGGAPRRLRELVTPEGVPVRVAIAGYGERAGALLIDLVIIVATAVALAFALGLAAIGGEDRSWFSVVFLLVWFFLRNGYFVCFELLWQGRTPGKRALGTRVVDRHGGRLKPQAIVVRNLMRELELFMPIGVYMGGLGGLAAGGDSGLFHLLLLIWVSIFALFPLFNRERMRAGDFVAGTWVVLMPRQILGQDMAGPERRRRGRDRAAAPAAGRFTRAQLEAYGEYELQTLEQVLRATGEEAPETRAEVARRIRRKIGWQEPPGGLDDRAFLEAYYTALRGHLESRMLFGRRRRTKHDRA